MCAGQQRTRYFCVLLCNLLTLTLGNRYKIGNPHGLCTFVACTVDPVLNRARGKRCVASLDFEFCIVMSRPKAVVLDGKAPYLAQTGGVFRRAYQRTVAQPSKSAAPCPAHGCVTVWKSRRDMLNLTVHFCPPCVRFPLPHCVLVS